MGPTVEERFRITIPSVDIGSGENLSLITAGSTASTAGLLVAYGNRESGCVQQPGSSDWTVWTPAWDDAN